MTASEEVLDRGLSADIADFIRGPHGHEIGDMIDRLSPVGNCAIFGGLARDFAREGRDAFKSDVDIVVHGLPGVLDALLSQMSGRRNQFGGYRLEYGRFDFDIWPLQMTWAARVGHVKVRSLTDLARTTFFDCDAVLFDCRTLEISRSDRFWTSIGQGIVDINLEPNPNYIGTLVRTLRILFDKKQKLAPRLARYLARGVEGSRKDIMDYAARDRRPIGSATEIDLGNALVSWRAKALEEVVCHEFPTPINI
ncbi:hypothetical protein [Mesorhizobium sp. CA5]|uniref:hypothetical protein n=1 Tax=Mesorhizobium sp. CA5 TaxID=2876638 RepID=UPI001CD10FCF|nr:hypothetical protein [Mesorhizobium sp. CA5]MBZ9845695.1 hypothetical protein [Mesorhizobium sp. CA5]